MTTQKRDRSASRQAALTERLRAAGLVPVQVWVRPERRAEVMALDQRATAGTAAASEAPASEAAAGSGARPSAAGA